MNRYNTIRYLTLAFFITTSAHAAVDMSELENQILQAVNKERQQKQLGELKFNDKLLTISRQHSTEMATSNTLAHELHGKTMESRVEGIGYKYSAIAENVAMTDGSMTTDLANTVVKMWMNSQGHRENILTPEYNEAGIGIATASNGSNYYTMVFGAGF